MGSTILALGLLPLVAVFVAIYFWTYKYVFNHEIIRNYSHRALLTTNELNALIQECNTKHGLFLLSVEDSGSSPYNSFNNTQSLESGSPKKTATDRVVGGVFASGTALSIELALLMLAQLAGIFPVNLTLLPILIKLLVVVVALIQPFLVISLYINQNLFPKPSLSSPLSVIRTALTLGLWLLWFLVLGWFGKIAAPLGETQGKSFIEEKTNDIVLAGVTITALLSGIGCALTPIRSLWINRQKKSGLETEKGEFRAINDLIQSYNATQMLEDKRLRELESVRLQNLGSVYNTPAPSGLRLMKQSGAQLFHKVQSFTSLSSFGSLESEETELEREIASLTLLKHQVYDDLCSKLQGILRTKRAQLASSRLNFSKYARMFDYSFSVYCIYRITNVLVFKLAFLFLMGSSQKPGVSGEATEHTRDALAVTIAKIIQSLFNYFPLSEDQLVHQISFLLSGLLFACSFQNVMITFKTIGRFLPTNTTSINDNIRGWLKNLIVSQLLAVYVIATALLIRSNLPLEAAQQMLNVLSLSSSSGLDTLERMLAEVDFVDAWFDRVFAFTSLVTVVIIGLKLYIDQDNGLREDYDEEMMIEEGRLKFM